MQTSIDTVLSDFIFWLDSGWAGPVNPYSKAYVAGGFLRERATKRGVPVKDVDVFLLNHAPTHMRIIEYLAKWGYKHVVTDIGEYGEDLATQVLKFSHKTLVDMDVIFVDRNIQTKEQLLDAFDIDLCKICWHPDEGFYAPEEFFKDLNNKTITYRQGVSPILPDHSPNHLHLQRVVAKYPDYAVIHIHR